MLYKISILLLVMILLTGCVQNTKEEDYNVSHTKPESLLAVLPIAQSATCTFRHGHSVSYSKKDFYSEEEIPQINFESLAWENENLTTFMDLDTEAPKMKGNNGQDDLLKIKDDYSSVVLIEATPLSNGSVILYQIFKESGIAIWTKSYSMPFIDAPFGLLSMGYCE